MRPIPGGVSTLFTSIVLLTTLMIVWRPVEGCFGTGYGPFGPMMGGFGGLYGDCFGGFLFCTPPMLATGYAYAPSPMAYGYGYGGGCCPGMLGRRKRRT
jgi:hypothetical protein